MERVRSCGACGPGGSSVRSCVCVEVGLVAPLGSWCVIVCSLYCRSQAGRVGVPELDLPLFEAEVPRGRLSTSLGPPQPPGTEEKGRDMEGAPFVLNSVLPVVPARLVRRIAKGDFVDMAELLRDNLEVEQRRAQSVLDTGQGVAPAGNRREVPDFTSWVQCFTLYASVVQSKFPEKGKDL